MCGSPIQGKGALLLVILPALVCLSACGQTAAGTSGQAQGASSNHLESIITSGQVAYVGSDNGRVYAFSATSGALQWQRRLGGPVTIYAVGDSAVYVSTSANGAVQAANTPAYVYALSAATGKVLWRFHHSGSLQFTLLVSGSTVYAYGASTIFALSASDGKELWQSSKDSSLGGLLGTGTGIVYFSQSPDQTYPPSTLFALDAGTGQVLWTATLPGSDGVPAGPPVESNGLVYVETNGGDIFALDAGTGIVAWHASTVASGNFPASSPMFPVVGSGLVYIGGPYGIAAFRATDGAVVWHYKTSEQQGFLPQPVLVSGVIYSSASDFVVALDASDGVLKWQREADGPTYGPMLVNDSEIISNGNASPVYALKTSDGSQLWQSSYTPADGWEGAPAGLPEALASDAGSSGVVLIGADSGVVHALSAGDGSQLWQFAIPELPETTPTVGAIYR